MSLLPLFPLPNVVLFPGALLPLHIFEPRYRAMVADALEDDRRLGMVLLRPGWERDYDGRPPIYPVGCSGVIIHSAKLDDGRYNIVLRGLDRIRIVDEDHARAYRRGAVEPLPDAPAGNGDRQAIADVREKLEEILQVSGDADAPSPLAAMSDDDLIHALAQGLDFEPIEKQALLECDGLRARAQSLLELLEMKRLQAGMPPAPPHRH